MIKYNYISSVLVSIITTSMNIGYSRALLHQLKTEQAKLKANKIEGYSLIQLEDCRNQMRDIATIRKQSCSFLKSLLKSL